MTGTGWRGLWARSHRAARGSAVALVTTAALTAIMVTVRGQVTPATTALVLVVPVVAATSVGGFAAGIFATFLCFAVYDFVFIPPYYTFYVNHPEDWAALCVYVVVCPLVARVLAVANAARSEAHRRADDARRLFNTSELLVQDLPTPRLLNTIVSSVRSAFGLEGAALLLPAAGHLDVVASTGAPLSEAEAARLSLSTGGPVNVLPAGTDPASLQAVALVANGKAVGLLAVRGAGASKAQQELLHAFANHLALALERAALREDAVKARLLEEVDQLRGALMGAVSHDLRTPLATIKLSASALLEVGPMPSPGDVKELAGLIDAQADRLERLVSNLLDMTRIQSGTLELRRQPVAVADLVEEALLMLGRAGSTADVQWDAPSYLPLVDVDHVLIRQVLANLIDNALKHSPPGAPVSVSATLSSGGKVKVSVCDSGRGVPAAARAGIFQTFNTRASGGQGGLGLAIAHAFVEAHGETIWVTEVGRSQPGAKFVFTLPIAHELDDPEDRGVGRVSS